MFYPTFYGQRSVTEAWGLFFLFVCSFWVKTNFENVVQGQGGAGRVCGENKFFRDLFFWHESSILYRILMGLGLVQAFEEYIINLTLQGGGCDNKASASVHYGTRITQDTKSKHCNQVEFIYLGYFILAMNHRIS